MKDAVKYILVFKAAYMESILYFLIIANIQLRFYYSVISIEFPYILTWGSNQIYFVQVLLITFFKSTKFLK